jgi:transketolase
MADGAMADTRAMANAIRALSMDAVQKANSGHPGMPMGMADVATVLFTKFLKFDAAAPNWPDRDRFVLSAGHGSMLLYSLLHLTGYAAMPMEEIRNFRTLGSATAGHPEYGHADGIETTTGPLGQGIANAVGFAIAERNLAARYGEDLVNHRTWVIAGDGCLMEGISQEAIGLAGKLRLNRLIVLWDDNDITIDGKVSNADITDQKARFEASGWHVLACDGHDATDIERALDAATKSDKPVLVACKTVIGYGAPNKAGTKSAHGEALGVEELAATKAALGWTAEPFTIPDDILAAWRSAGARGAKAHADWHARLAPAEDRATALQSAIGGHLPATARTALQTHKDAMAAEKPALATRASSGKALDVLVPAWTNLVGGSADLTGSNNTYVKGTKVIAPEDFSGVYINYGVREHGMAAAMNGMALHGGVVPYGGTFLAFADYSRPAIRLAALMGIRVIHVMTHDSIGLGEDGPTHQPVEQVAALRAIPNCYVWRPCDAVEAAECWEAAIDLEKSPSILALSRQAVPGLRGSAAQNLSAKGAYELFAAEGAPAAITIFATGTEVSIAVDARAKLQAAGKPTRVVSVPCFEAFADQDETYRASVIGTAPMRIAIEAGVKQGWDVFLRPEDTFIGMKSFGASAPAKDLYPHFGITADAVVAAAG